MNKKPVSQKVKKLCAPFAMIYGLGIWFVAVTEILVLISSRFIIGEWFDKLLSGVMLLWYYPVMVVMYYLNQYVFMLPVVVVLALITFGIIYTRRDGNIRNVFNVYVWGTALLVVLYTVLRYAFLSQFF